MVPPAFSQTTHGIGAFIAFAIKSTNIVTVFVRNTCHPFRTTLRTE
jgi:hypothetical protein